MKIFELVIDEEAELYGIDAVSLVENPAIESNFVALSKDADRFVLADASKRIVMGPALIPDKPIYRVKDGEEFYIFFQKKTIRRAMELYLKNAYTNNTTLEHEAPVKGAYVIESWIVEDVATDKQKLYGMANPVGTWMITMKIDNEELWEQHVKEGKVRGFSIEGYFANKFDLKAEDHDLESFSDYGEGVRNNAKRGLELNENQGNSCATQVGKVRAQQLAQGKPISVETIKRMYSYLSRAEAYYDPNKTTECGTISYLLWGGKAALGWARNKLNELDALEEIEELCKELEQNNVNVSNP